MNYSELCFDRSNDADLNIFVQLIARLQNQGVDFELDASAESIRILIKK